MNDNTDENVPEVTVEASGVKIEVTDRRSAEAALPFIEGTLEHYLREEPETVDRATPRKFSRQQFEPVAVECDKCGYEWEYKGRGVKSTTCPNCQGHVRFDPDLVEQGVRPDPQGAVE